MLIVFDKMQSKPNGRSCRIGPFHAMAYVGGNEDVIAWGQCAYFFAFDAQSRRTLEENDPFGSFLVIPLPGRCGLTCRDNSFEFEMRRVQQSFKKLVGHGGGKVGEKVFRVHRGRLPRVLAVCGGHGEMA